MDQIIQVVHFQLQQSRHLVHGHNKIEEVNSLSITKDGDMYAILKRTNTSQVYFYKLNYNASGSGTATHISSVTSNLGTGDNNAATYYEYESGGTTYKYIFTSKGFFNGNNKAIRLNADGSYKVISVSISSGSTWTSNKAKDYAWIENSTTHDFIAFNSNTNDLLGATVSHTNVGASNESISVALTQRANNVGSSMSSNSGAAMTMGDGVVYFLENDDGRLWKYDYANDTSTGNNTNEFVLTSDSFNNSSNTDGAGCGTAPIEPPAGSVTAGAASQGSCSSGAATANFTLSATGTTMFYDLQRRIDTGSGFSSWVTTVNGGSISAGGSFTAGTGTARDHGTVVEYQYRVGSSNPSSGSYISVDSNGDSLSITINCPTTSWTATSSLGSCSSGTAVPSIAIENTGNTTNYFDVQYKIDSGSWTTTQDGNGITAGSTETYTISAQAHTSVVYWQVRAGTSNPSSGSYVSTTSSDGSGSTLTNTVDCVTGQVTAAVDAGTCSGTSSTPKVTITNGTNETKVVDVQYKIGSSGTWEDLADGSSISAGSFTIFTLGSAQAHNTEVYFQFRFDTSNPSSGSYITTQNTDGAGAGSTLLATVDCENVDPSATESFTSTCSAGARTNTLTLSNSASANATVYFYVEYSTDGGSSWTKKASNQSVAADSSETLTQSVAHGEAITWRYKTSSTSGSFTNDYTTMSASATVDCDPDHNSYLHQLVLKIMNAC